MALKIFGRSKGKAAKDNPVSPAAELQDTKVSGGNEAHERLMKFRKRYDYAWQMYQPVLQKIKRNQALYDGNYRPNEGKGETPRMRRNITKELVEAQVSSWYGMPKVSPRKCGWVEEQRARIIEAALKDEMERMNYARIHDESRRTVIITGGNYHAVEWDNNKVSATRVGDIVIRNITPSQLIPQPCVNSVSDMDYFFLVTEQTKENIYSRFGVNVNEEVNENDASADDTVTVYWCYYRNKNHGIGLFVWAGDTIIADFEGYQHRHWQVCAKCGNPKPYDSDECVICGSKDFVSQEMEYEELAEDIVQFAGTEYQRVIPAESPEIDDTGKPVFEDAIIDVPMFDPRTGEDMGIVPVPERHAKMAKTRIPYYVPREFPVVLERNISVAGQLLGDSDCDTVRALQELNDELLTNASEKMIKGGSVLAYNRNLHLRASDEIGKVLEFDNVADIQGLQHINLACDVSQELGTMNFSYDAMKRLLGLSDSFMGFADTTARSGEAKQLQIRQAAGRLDSKRLMQNAAMADMYRQMFHLMLAYFDEPRTFVGTDEKGDKIEYVFNRYDFLDYDDKTGNWYYDDDFTFDVDVASSADRNREYMWQTIQQNMQYGAYGDLTNPHNMLAVWRHLDARHYPDAGVVIEHIQSDLVPEFDRRQQLAEQQQEAQFVQQQMVNENKQANETRRMDLQEAAQAARNMPDVPEEEAITADAAETDDDASTQIQHMMAQYNEASNEQ